MDRWEFRRRIARSINYLHSALIRSAADCQRTSPAIGRLWRKWSNTIGGGARKLDERLREPGSSLGTEPSLVDGTLLNVAIEHRLMHDETLAYLLHNLPHARKIHSNRRRHDSRPAPYAREVTIPSGIATLGQPRAAKSFGWDNEFGAQRVLVPSFSIDVFPVTNAEYLKFVQDGGYQDAKYWRNEDWEWRRKQESGIPALLAARIQLVRRTIPTHNGNFAGCSVRFRCQPSWPVYVSHAEASAYARWAGKKLPTEEQWHRAAYGTTEGRERQYPWGDEPPDETRGNFHHQSWDPAAGG